MSDNEVRDKGVNSPGTNLSEYARLPRFSVQQGDATRAHIYIRWTQVVVRTIFLLFFRVQVKGLPYLPPSPVIICTNHLGWADPFLVLLFFPVEPRIYVLADHRAVSRTGFRAAVMRFLQLVVPLDPDNGFQALRSMSSVLHRGGSLLISPEGAPTHNPQEGQVRELRHGASLLSVTTGVPLLPVGISGTSELWLRRTLRMRVGKPINPRDFEGGRRDRTRAMTAELQRSLRSLLPPTGTRPRVRFLRRWLTNLFS